MKKKLKKNKKKDPKGTSWKKKQSVSLQIERNHGSNCESTQPSSSHPANIVDFELQPWIR